MLGFVFGAKGRWTREEESQSEDDSSDEEEQCVPAVRAVASPPAASPRVVVSSPSQAHAQAPDQALSTTADAYAVPAAAPGVGATPAAYRAPQLVVAPRTAVAPDAVRAAAAGAAPGLADAATPRGVQAAPTAAGAAPGLAGAAALYGVPDLPTALRCPPAVPEEDATTAGLHVVCSRISADSNGWISKLQLIQGMQRDSELAQLVLPGVDSDALLRSEAAFDELDAIFMSIAGGKSRIKQSDLVAYLHGVAREQPSRQPCELQRLFGLIDVEGGGSVSKLQLLDAVRRDPEVASLILAGVHGGLVGSDADAFDAVDRLFEAAGGGRRRITFASFRDHFHSAAAVQPPVARTNTGVQRERSSIRVFLLDPGAQYQMANRPVVEQAGFQVHWCTRFPPIEPAAPFPGHLMQELKDEIDSIRPHVLMCASKAAIYSYGLWQAGAWQGPTVLINPHPVCQRFPPGTPVVLAHGGIDETFKIPRVDLEKIVYADPDSKSLLYYVGQNLHLGSTLKKYDCLGRLVDAAVCPDGPETYMMRSWRERKAPERIEAERALGCTLEQVRKRWASQGQRGRDSQTLYDVLADSEEFRQVVGAFRAQPPEPASYPGRPESKFGQVQITRVQRVENGLQVDGCSKPYMDALSRSLEDQGMEFEPGVHTSWAFHGSPEVDSIITNPMAGIQPLAAGTKNSTLWGSGTYFARDAKYVVDGCFDIAGGVRPADGVRRILMCLLVTGIPCLGDPEQKGVLPFRKYPHRFHASVDSLSSPEIYVVQHPGAAHPGYVITFTGA